jgi:hypothetical protein
MPPKAPGDHLNNGKRQNIAKDMHPSSSKCPNTRQLTDLDGDGDGDAAEVTGGFGDPQASRGTQRAPKDGLCQGKRQRIGQDTHLSSSECINTGKSILAATATPEGADGFGDLAGFVRDSKGSWRMFKPRKKTKIWGRCTPFFI